MSIHMHVITGNVCARTNLGLVSHRPLVLGDLLAKGSVEVPELGEVSDHLLPLLPLLLQLRLQVEQGRLQLGVLDIGSGQTA